MTSATAKPTATDIIARALSNQRILLDAGPSPRSLHRLALWLRCKQLYAWTYLAPMEYRPKKRRKALNRGSLTHLGTAHAYTRAKVEEEGGDPETLYTAEEAIEIKAGQMAATEPPPLIEVEKQTALAVLKAYKRQVALDLDRYRVVEVEKIVWFCVNGVWYTQRLDLLLEDRANGLLYVTDHKCQPADALVETERGAVTVRALVDGGRAWAGRLVGWHDGRLGWAEKWAIASAGMQDVYAVALASGSRCRFGYRHPVLTRFGWREAAKLRIGDEVAVARTLPDSPDADLTDADLTVLGMLACDGSLKRSTVVYTKTDSRIRARFVAALKRLGLRRTVPIKVKGQRMPSCSFAVVAKRGKVPYVALAARGPVTALLTPLGLQGVGSADKRLNLLPRLSTRQVGVLLGALWSGDGAAYVNAKRAKSGKVNKTVQITYASRSEGLVHDVRALLTRVGLVTTLVRSSVEYKGARRGYYFVTVVGRESKQAFLRAVASGQIVAPELRARARQMLKLLKSKGKQGSHCAQTIEGAVYWDRVESVLFEGREECFDVEVPGIETFVTEGLVTHNSSANPTSNTFSGFAPSLQMQGYRWWGPQMFGERWGGLFVNVLGFEKDKDTGELKTTVDRRLVEPAPQLVARFPQTIIDVEAEIAAYATQGRRYDQYPPVSDEVVCVHRYGRCEAFDLCLTGATKRDPNFPLVSLDVDSFVEGD